MTSPLRGGPSNGSFSWCRCVTCRWTTTRTSPQGVASSSSRPLSTGRVFVQWGQYQGATPSLRSGWRGGSAARRSLSSKSRSSEIRSSCHSDAVAVLLGLPGRHSPAVLPGRAFRRGGSFSRFDLRLDGSSQGALKSRSLSDMVVVQPEWRGGLFRRLKQPVNRCLAAAL